MYSNRTTQVFKPRAPKKIMAHGVTGRVVWFNINKGYGFIHSDHNDNDIFVHNSDIAKNNPNKLIKSLAQGEVVMFDIALGINNMPRAVNVTGPNFSPVQGSKYAPDRWPRYNQLLSNHQNYRGRSNSYKNRQNINPNYKVKTVNVRQYAKESNHTDSSNKTTKISATCYQPISNKVEEVKPQSEIFKLYLKQDELVKESLKLTQSIDSIKLKIGELENKVLGKQM